MPTPSLVMIADVSAFCLNSSHTYLRTAVNGASSGTLTTLYGSLGSEVSVTLNCTCWRKAQQTRCMYYVRPQIRSCVDMENGDARRGTGNGISMQPVPRRLSQRARTLLPDAAGGMAGLLCLTTRRGLPFQKLRTENYNSNNNDKETL